MESTQLYQALVAGNEDEALKQLSEPPSDLDLAVRNERGETFLHVATRTLKSVQVNWGFIQNHYQKVVTVFNKIHCTLFYI